uniref:Reverse transcriptase n=1 Tax=Peronospora matthiolae TaxID=2874970 RepID=A0AAV1VP33_9STRA
MRFWWPDWEPRERSLSSDSECSTDSHSSLASDASFYDASPDDETGVGHDEIPPLPDDTQLVTGEEAGQSDLRLFPESSSPFFAERVGRNCLGTVAVGQGVGVHTGTSNNSLPGPQNGPRVRLRAPSPRGDDAELGAATSGTGSDPASPSAYQVSARTEVSVAREAPRSPAPILGAIIDREEARRPPVGTSEGTFDNILGLSIGVAAIHDTIQDNDQDSSGQDSVVSAGLAEATRPPPASSARRLASPASSDAPAAAVASQDEDAIVGIPGRAGVTLPDRVSPTQGQGLQSDGSPGASMRRPGTKTCTKGIYTLRSALPDVGAAQDTASDDVGPVRAASMLPDRVQHGHLQSVGSPGAHRQPPGPDACATGPPALPLAPEAPAAARDPAIVAPPPGRAARMLPDRVQLGSALVAATARALGAFQGPSDPEDSENSDGGAPDDDTASSMDDDAATSSSDDDRLGHVATELPARAGYTAVAAAPHHGLPRLPPARPCPLQQLFMSHVPVTTGSAGRLPYCLTESGVTLRCLAATSRPLLLGPAPATTAAVPMEVDQGATWQAASLTPPSPPLVLRLNGKRRRLNDEDDGDEREQAEQLLLEDVEAGPMNSALWPSTASALPASVLAVYAHNAQRFTCTLCTYTASSFASLKRHRDSRHRRIAFLDRFSAGCACGTPFVSRLAAANHARACASLRDTSAATASAAGDLSPTAGAVNATATVADTEPVLPRQDPPVLTVSPPQSSTTHDRSTESRWSPPLPRQLVASRVASRLSEVPAPRWGPPLPRSVVVSRIADRLLPPELTEEEETKAGDSDDEDVNDDPDMDGEWLLRFDGACRANPGPGGAGAALFKPSGPVVWTCSHYMPSSGETNNTAEYTALLLGTRAAADHGVTRLRIEGDSTLVIQQVRGIFATRNKRLRQLRIAVKAELARMERATLHPIDRQANGHVDRLANAALDRRTTTLECGVHTDGHGCTSTSTTAPAPAAAPPPATPHVAVGTEDPPSPADDDDMGDIDDGEVYAAISVGPDAVPPRRSRLRLRQLNEDEGEAAGKLVERLAARLAAKITDADDWEEAEGYITALPYALYDQLQPYSQTQHPAQPHSQRPQLHHPDVRPARRPEPHQGPAQAVTLDGQRQGGSRSRRRRGHSGGGMGRRRTRPPRVTRHHREHRLDEALDAMHAVQRSEPGNRKVVAKARRRVGRITSSISQQRLRHLFETSEKVCVESILATARSQREADEAAATPASTSAPPPDCVAVEEDTCPIPGESLHRFFTEVNSPVGAFDPMAPVGASFRAAMDRLPPATVDMALLTDGPSSHEIEDQVQRARGSSSPGLDGVGYDIFKLFTAQLLPALHAAFARCWQSKRVPQSWKVGVVRLLHKKGDRLDPSNWRPICLQQAIYKLYAGVLSRRFTRWLDVNGRHADAQKGFRAMNGCGEHNFLAAMLVDQARRKHQELHVVWYDFANAFGSVPHDLLWEALQRQGVPPEFVACCRGLYADAAFTIGNAVDGTTAPIALKVGVFQGCPLSPHLFTAAIAPLLHALKSLPDTGVTMSSEDRPGAAAYADDLKTFSSTVDGIQRQHSVVHDFLRWTGIKANSLKCSTMSVQRDVRGLHQTSDLGLQLNGTPIPALSASDSYQYLGIGDGFDHVRRRVELGPAIAQLKHDATALLQSGLAPWQVVKAVKVYLYPRVEYALRHLRPFAQQLEGFDRHLVRGLRHLLRLPTSATTAFLYAPVSRGGLGLLPLTELHGALQVAHGWQMLHSSDPATQRIARQQLRQIAEARYKLDVVLWKDREEELGELLLNSKLGASDPAPPKRRNADIGSLWFDVRGSPSPLRPQVRDGSGGGGDRDPGAKVAASRAPPRWLVGP